jgi:hypothetical protein
MSGSSEEIVAVLQKLDSDSDSSSDQYDSDLDTGTDFDIRVDANERLQRQELPDLLRSHLIIDQLEYVVSVCRVPNIASDLKWSLHF